MKQHQAEKLDALASQLIAVLGEAQDEEAEPVSLTELLWGNAPRESLQKLRDLLNPPDVRAVHVACTDETLRVSLQDGRRLIVPLACFPRLMIGTRDMRDNWRLVAGGTFIHWDVLDEDLSINGLLSPHPLARPPSTE